MKKLVVKALTQISLLAVIATASAVQSAHGQSLAYQIRAKIPFDFTVADKRLPAGEYSIGRAHQSSGDIVLLISSVEGGGKAFRLTGPANTQKAKDQATLVFHRYGDQYFLSEVWAAGTTTGRKFFESRREREAKARRLATNGATKTETVTVVSGPQ